VTWWIGSTIGKCSPCLGCYKISSACLVEENVFVFQEVGFVYRFSNLKYICLCLFIFVLDFGE